MRSVAYRNVVMRRMYVIPQWENTNDFCNNLICFVRVAVISIKHTHRLRIACSRSQCVSTDRLLDGTSTTMARRRNNSKFVRAELEVGVVGEGALPWKHAQVLRDVTLLTRRPWTLWTARIGTRTAICRHCHPPYSKTVCAGYQEGVVFAVLHVPLHWTWLNWLNLGSWDWQGA